jgi:glyoxylase-like metal-dependent hydrolase (beta-lactamase superfamily II)
VSALDVRSFTVGPAAENTYVVRAENSDHALLIDPGDEAERLIGAIDALGVTIDAILVTHTHFDHVGAVAALARHTQAPVYVPELERFVLANIEEYTPLGFGPFESYDAEHTLAGGERLELAGLTLDVIHTPGHSPGHLTYALGEHGALLSGDVIFRESVGRVDLPGGDWPTLLGSIAGLLDAYDDETVVYPGHMRTTTLGYERASNPFLAELRATAAG